jgi:hypothetical protein
MPKHSGISRSAACNLVSAERLRPAARRPFVVVGSRLRYGIWSVGKLGVRPGHRPMLSRYPPSLRQ